MRKARRWFRFGRRDLFFVAPVLVLCAMFYRGCAQWAILHPNANPIAPRHAQRELIPVSIGGDVEVWRDRTDACAAGEPEAFVLRFCGNGERAEDAVDKSIHRWAGRPVEVWAENHPGYGGSTAEPTLANLAPAALAAYDRLKAHAGTRPIFLSAHSLGNTELLYVSSRRPIAGAILHDPPPLRELIIGRFGWWNLWILARGIADQVPESLDTITNARATTAPAVFITGESDGVIPPKYQTMVYDAYAGPKRRIFQKNAGHNDPIVGADYDQLESDIDWLWSEAGLRRHNAPPSPLAR